MGVHHLTKSFIICFTVMLSLGNSLHAQEGSVELLTSQLTMAGDNRVELEKALADATESQKVAVRFLIENMPKKDLESLSSKFILDNVNLALKAKEESPWSAQVSEELFLNYVLPYANVDETRELWRKELYELCWPIVKDCKTTGEAAQLLNKKLFSLVNVRYSTKRKKANQSPSESMDQGLASCTGLSILLVDACRSVNVPARLVGIPSWTNKRGNHTWVEVWDDGDWHFTGACEYNAGGLDRAWFVGDAALADKSKKLNSIYAVSFKRTDTVFPMVWSRDPNNAVYATNVTDRYTPDDEPETVADHQILVRIRVWNADRSKRIPVKLTVKGDDLKEPLTGSSRDHNADMNDMAEFKLDRGRDYELVLENQQTVKFQTADQETQLIEITVEE